MKRLACPKCRSTDLASDEVSTTRYPVQLTRGDDGAVQVDYTGGWSETFDEGTVYAGDIFCNRCGLLNISESDLIELNPCRECGEQIETDDEHAGHGMCGSCLHDAERSGWTPTDA